MERDGKICFLKFGRQGAKPCHILMLWSIVNRLRFNSLGTFDENRAFNISDDIILNPNTAINRRIFLLLLLLYFFILLLFLWPLDTFGYFLEKDTLLEFLVELIKCFIALLIGNLSVIELVEQVILIFLIWFFHFFLLNCFVLLIKIVLISLEFGFYSCKRIKSFIS